MSCVAGTMLLNLPVEIREHVFIVLVQHSGLHERHSDLKKKAKKIAVRCLLRSLATCKAMRDMGASQKEAMYQVLSSTLETKTRANAHLELIWRLAPGTTWVSWVQSPGRKYPRPPLTNAAIMWMCVEWYRLGFTPAVWKLICPPNRDLAWIEVTCPHCKEKTSRTPAFGWKPCNKSPHGHLNDCPGYVIKAPRNETLRAKVDAVRAWDYYQQTMALISIYRITGEPYEMPSPMRRPW